jgi:hypothetical protein
MKSLLTSKMGFLPAYGWAGLVLVIVFWILNWSLNGLRSHWAFFPLWFGYCLTIDALVFMRKGHSLLTRSPVSYMYLFLISMPAWWLFELINLRTQNWYYVGRHYFSDPEFFLFSSLSFSTVMPAVFGTAEFAGTFMDVARPKRERKFRLTASNTSVLFISGWIMFVMMMIWPQFFFPFVWLSAYCILDPLNFWIGNRSLVQEIAEGEWSSVLALSSGCLMCGLFWEMWNFYSFPKWIYQIPFVNFFHVFEMPILGYLGYIPFSLELFALYHLIAGFIRSPQDRDYLQLSNNKVN